jgi:ectoine hydroxylase-related dioxygenase (phytanoyl-CoA dioxygenase family)
MQFIPYSHLGNLRPHHPMGNDPLVHTLETDDVDPSKAVPCPIPAGGCTIHQPKTMHYTAPNDTDVPRRAWILFFGYPIPQ